MNLPPVNPRLAIPMVVLAGLLLSIPVAFGQPAGAGSFKIMQPSAVRHYFGLVEPTNDPQMASLDRTFDSGDSYDVDGQTVRLLRLPNEVAVRFSNTLQSQQALQMLQQAPGSPATRVLASASLPGRGGGISVLRTIDEDAVLDAAALAGLPAVDYAYPVLLDPESACRMVPTDEVLARFPDGTPLAEVRAAVAASGLQVLERTGTLRMQVYLLRLNDPKTTDPLTASGNLAGSGRVLWAQPNFLREIRLGFTPNDSLYTKQQHLHNIGQNGATADADIDAPEAWDTSTGSSSIVIAIIDDGIDVAHSDLSIYSNPGETGGGKESNGVDDDGNGKIDDYRGWDFATGDNNPSPVGSNGHGTACAGVAAALGNNATLAAGASHSSKILPVKIIDDAGVFVSDSVLGSAISYAADHADVLSNSWGGGSPSSYINNAIDDAVANGRGGKGCPVFFSTGNSASTWYRGGSRARLLTEGLSGSYYLAFVYGRGTTSAGENAVRIDNICLLDADGYTHKTAILPRQNFEGVFPPVGWAFGRGGGATADWSRSSTNAATGCTGSFSACSPQLSTGQIAGLFTPLLNINGDETLAFAMSVSMSANSIFVVDAYDSALNYLGSWGPWNGVPTVTTAVAYPANYANSIGVGSSTDCDRRSDYSQYGSALAFLAPSNGGWNDIVTLDPTGAVGWTTTDYKTNFGGTSSACPLAAGVAALMLSRCPDLSPAQVRTLMENSCDKIGGIPYVGGVNTYYGHGRINAASALALVGLPSVAPTGASVDRDNFCADDPGNIQLTATGGSGETLRWFDNACGVNAIGTGSSLVIPSPTQTTTYYVRWETGCNNSTCASVTVTVRPLAVVPAGAVADRNNFCTDDAGDIQLTATGGSGDTLRWFDNACGVNAIGTGSPLVIPSPTQTTTYYVRWENGCGSSACRSVTVNVIQFPVAPTGVSSDRNDFCTNDAGTIRLTALGGAGSILRWFDDSCGGHQIGTGTPLTIFSPAATTTYYARWDTACGVSTCANMTVTVFPQPNAPTECQASPADMCAGASSILSAVPGAGGDTLEWFTQSCGGTPVSGGATPTVSPSATTVYYARTKNSVTGCVSDACCSVTVTVHELPPVPWLPKAEPAVICSGEASILSTAPASGGDAIEWFTGSCAGVAVPGGSSPAVTPATTTTYYARRRSAATGCLSATCAAVTITVDPPPDTDGDGVVDRCDNCPDVVDPTQADTDGDLVGDACDNCPTVANTDQANADDDAPGDACDPDDDDDSILDDADGSGVAGDHLCTTGQTTNCDDNCRTVPNVDQMNADGDAAGDACDPDDDNDTVLDDGDANGIDGDHHCMAGQTAGCDDNCPTVPNSDQADADRDGVGDICDNCPLVQNAGQDDYDNDGVGDFCDNSRFLANSDQQDFDSNGQGDIAEDGDSDGITAALDNCPFDANSGQTDSDGDGRGDVCDNCPSIANADQADRDGDRVGNACDNCPYASNADQADTDGDGQGNVCDVERPTPPGPVPTPPADKPDEGEPAESCGSGAVPTLPLTVLGFAGMRVYGARKRRWRE